MRNTFKRIMALVIMVCMLISFAVINVHAVAPNAKMFLDKTTYLAAAGGEFDVKVYLTQDTDADYKAKFLAGDLTFDNTVLDYVSASDGVLVAEDSIALNSGNKVAFYYDGSVKTFTKTAPMATLKFKVKSGLAADTSISFTWGVVAGITDANEDFEAVTTAATVGALKSKLGASNPTFTAPTIAKGVSKTAYTIDTLTAGVTMPTTVSVSTGSSLTGLDNIDLPVEWALGTFSSTSGDNQPQAIVGTLKYTGFDASLFSVAEASLPKVYIPVTLGKATGAAPAKSALELEVDFDDSTIPNVVSAADLKALLESTASTKEISVSAAGFTAIGAIVWTVSDSLDVSDETATPVTATGVISALTGAEASVIDMTTPINVTATLTVGASEPKKVIKAYDPVVVSASSFVLGGDSTAFKTALEAAYAKTQVDMKGTGVKQGDYLDKAVELDWSKAVWTSVDFTKIGAYNVVVPVKAIDGKIDANNMKVNVVVNVNVAPMATTINDNAPQVKGMNEDTNVVIVGNLTSQTVLVYYVGSKIVGVSVVASAASINIKDNAPTGVNFDKVTKVMAHVLDAAPVVGTPAASIANKCAFTK